MNREIEIKINNVEFYVTIEENSEHSITFNVEETVSWSLPDHKPSDRDHYLKAYIKWDGCSHFWFGDREGYMHLCGVNEIMKFRAVLLELWKLAEKEIERFTKDETIEHYNSELTE